MKKLYFSWIKYLPILSILCLPAVSMSHAKMSQARHDKCVTEMKNVKASWNSASVSHHMKNQGDRMLRRTKHDMKRGHYQAAGKELRKFDSLVVSEKGKMHGKDKKDMMSIHVKNKKVERFCKI